MRLCNPDCLIEWRKVEPPKFKKDYQGKLLQVEAFTHYGYEGINLPPDGSVCEITGRGNDFGGGEFKLTLAWRCPCCGREHQQFVKESWLAEGKAHFVEPVGLADNTQALGEDRPAVIYLATSYSHPEAAKRAARAQLASQCAGWLMGKGWPVLSPLSMGHIICSECPDLEADFATWREPCLRMLEMSDAVAVLLLDGLRESKGLSAEIDHARKLGIPLNQIKLGSKEDGEPFEVVPNPRWWR